MVSVAVITSIYGNYDVPARQPAQDMDADWILVTDRREPPAPPPWNTIIAPSTDHPRLAAKLPKCQPWWYTNADITIWIDGCVEIDSHDFVSWCVESLQGTPLAQHHAVSRSSILGEARVAMGMRKYFGQPLIQQAQSYVDAGHPDEWGLWWTGLIVRTRDCPDFGTPWLAEQTKWTIEDQISQPYVLRSMGLRPTNIPITWPPKRFHRRDHNSDL